MSDNYFANDGDVTYIDLRQSNSKDLKEIEKT